ncbi:MAG TPA: DNA-processing protein DprA [Actinomycetota bacterium]|nr:DNA-processing protein DprA [Actinomycetota bacterium]
MNPTRRIEPGHDEWPAQLDELGSEAPKELYLAGLPLKVHEDSIAIVGAREASAAGLEAASTFARQLAEAKFTIVSGLARGIDAAAHKGALEARGHTIAVVGCGLDIDYPVANSGLKRAVMTHGTVVSEYPEGTSPNYFNFPPRNRIIAGLCKATLIIEGGEKSGALITARYALDFNREVLALPGSYRNPLAYAPNELIRTGQAALVTSVQQIFDELSPGTIWGGAAIGTSRLQIPDLDDDECQVLFFLDDRPIPPDHVCRTLGLEVGRAALVLSRLEIRGWASRKGGGYELTRTGAGIKSALMTA